MVNSKGLYSSPKTICLISILLSCTLSPAVAFLSVHQHARPAATSPVLNEAATPFSIAGPSQDLLDRFSNQVSQELAASQFYLSASIWFESRDWEGMASYMLAESSEERGHALQLIDFANKRNIPVTLRGLDAPNADWERPLDVWKDVLKLEKSNTVSLLRLAEVADECQDYAVLACLNPFHMEQVDSESNIATIIAKVSDENRTPGLLRQLDHELGMEAGGGHTNDVRV